MLVTRRILPLAAVAVIAASTVSLVCSRPPIVTSAPTPHAVAPAELAVRSVEVAHEGPPSAINIAARIVELGTRKLTALAPATTSDSLIRAIGACTRPNASQRKQLASRVVAWINDTYKAERPSPAVDVTMRFGCVEAAGVVIDVNADRTARGSKRPTVGRWWTLRVAADRVTMLAEASGTPLDDWMEWANEVTVTTVALVDLDHDGTRDVVSLHDIHEGGATHSEFDISVTTARATKPVVTMHGGIHMPAGDDLIFALEHEDGSVSYRCLGSDFGLELCPAARAGQRREQRLEIAQRWRTMRPEQVPDREQLADELAALGITGEDRTQLLAAAAAPTPAQHAQHRVAGFLAQAVADRFARDREDEAVMLAIRDGLGDAPCAADDSVRAAAEAWLHGRAGAQVIPACGPYAWATWDTAKIHGQALLYVTGAGAAPVIEATSAATGDPTNPPSDPLVAAFYRHQGAAVVALTKGDQLVAIAGGKLVAKRAGVFQPYGHDLFRDKHWWHATPAGLERPPAAVQQLIDRHEARRAAIEIVEGFVSSGFAQDRAELARALELLGAGRELVDDVTR